MAVCKERVVVAGGGDDLVIFGLLGLGELALVTVVRADRLQLI